MAASHASPRGAGRSHEGAAAPPGHRRAWLRSTHWGRGCICAAAFVVGVASTVEPSTVRLANATAAGLAVAAVAAAGSTARRWTWVMAAGPALALAAGLAAGSAAGAALTVALIFSRTARPPTAAGAAVGALSAMSLLHATDLGFHGSSALAAATCLTPMVISGYRHAGRRARWHVRLVAAATGGGVVVAVVVYMLAVAAARPAAERGANRLEEGLAAARRGDDVAAAGRLKAAANAFGEADRVLGGWWTAPAHLLPVLSYNARAAEALVGAAADLSAAGSYAAIDADADELRVHGGRLDIERLRALQPPLDDVLATLDTASRKLDRARTPWLADPLSDRMDQMTEEIAGARPDVQLVADAARLLPAMLGDGAPTRWFVAFVTPVEARGNTGLIGNFAELVVTDGKIEMTHFGRARELEEAGAGESRMLSGPGDYLAHWGRFDPAGTWRNVTMSPDFPSVGRVVTELYPQSGGEPLDGVIAVDPTALAALLRFTGPVTVPGVAEPLTTDTAAEFLLISQYSQLSDTRERVDSLDYLARAVFDKLTTGDLPAPRDLADVLAETVAGGHLHLYSPEPDRQRLFRRIGVDGALPAADGGDTLAVVNNNASGNKIDAFLQRDIRDEVRWDPDTGNLAVAVTINLINDAPRARLPEYVIGSPLPDDRLPPGTNRTYLSVYSPWDLEAVSVDGMPMGIERQEERGMHAYSLFLDIPPEGGRRVVTLALRGTTTAQRYRLDVSTQPLVKPDRLSLSVEVDGTSSIEASGGLTVDGRRAVGTALLDRERSRFLVATTKESNID